MSRRTPITLLALATVATTLLASTAHAQPSSTEPGEKRGLSQINGAPIKVGEHSQYYYEYTKWNISGNPIGPIFNMYSLAVTRAVSSHVAFSGEVSIFVDSSSDEYDYDNSWSQLSLTAPIYFKQMHQGFYLEPGVLIRSSARSQYDSYDDGDTFGPQLLVGWHWTWDSGMNAQFAFGAGNNLNRSASHEKTFANGYFRVGYTF